GCVFVLEEEITRQMVLHAQIVVHANTDVVHGYARNHASPVIVARQSAAHIGGGKVFQQINTLRSEHLHRDLIACKRLPDDGWTAGRIGNSRQRVIELDRPVREVPVPFLRGGHLRLPDGARTPASPLIAYKEKSSICATID